MLEKKAPWYIRTILKAVKKDAIVLFGRAYYLEKPESYSLHLRLHELCHVHQWGRYGLAFPFLYLAECWMVGYDKNKFELEAESFARMKKSEKYLYPVTYVMSDTEYLYLVYQEEI